MDRPIICTILIQRLFLKNKSTQFAFIIVSLSRQQRPARVTGTGWGGRGILGGAGE